MIDNNTKTVFAMDKIYFESPDSWVDGLFDSTEYAMELDKRNAVLEGICACLKMASNDVKLIIKELNARYRKMGIEEGTPKSVKNWIAGTPVNPAYRANLYNLCLALNLILLFLLGFISLPFAHDPQALLFDKIVHISSQILCICGSVDIGIKNYKFYKKYIK